MKVATKIVPVGNGFGVEIPQKFLESCRIIPGDVITLDLKKTVTLSANFSEHEYAEFDRILHKIPVTEKDKMSCVELIVRDICIREKDKTKCAELKEIIAEATEMKITESVVKTILNLLKIQGILFEPKNGIWRWIE